MIDDIQNPVVSRPTGPSFEPDTTAPETAVSAPPAIVPSAKLRQALQNFAASGCTMEIAAESLGLTPAEVTEIIAPHDWAGFMHLSTKVIRARTLASLTAQAAQGDSKSAEALDFLRPGTAAYTNECESCLRIKQLTDEQLSDLQRVIDAPPGWVMSLPDAMKVTDAKGNSTTVAALKAEYWGKRIITSGEANLALRAKAIEDAPGMTVEDLL